MCSLLLGSGEAFLLNPRNKSSDAKHWKVWHNTCIPMKGRWLPTIFSTNHTHLARRILVFFPGHCFSPVFKLVKQNQMLEHPPKLRRCSYCGNPSRMWLCVWENQLRSTTPPCVQVPLVPEQYPVGSCGMTDCQPPLYRSTVTTTGLRFSVHPSLGKCLLSFLYTFFTSSCAWTCVHRLTHMCRVRNTNLVPVVKEFTAKTHQTVTLETMPEVLREQV